MAAIKSDVVLLPLPLILLLLGLLVFTSSVVAMDMDHSKHNMGKKKATHETDNLDPWSDEEFDNGWLDEELNTEIGIIVHHQHKSGNWMIGYKNMTMSMKDLIRGTQEKEGNEKVTSEQIARTLMGSSNPQVAVSGFDYLMAPVDMSMNMQMLTAMYGMTETSSLMVMTSYLQNKMNMVMHMGNASNIMSSRNTSMATSGISDTIVSAMIRASDSWTISFALNLPTGSINEKVNMNGKLLQAPYKMQLGSGTVDFLQSVTYKGGDSRFNWGYQESFTYHAGANNNGYVLGNKFEFSAWVRKTFANKFSISSRINLFDQGQIEGRDVKIMNASMSTTFDPANTGRHQADFSIGFSKRFDSGNRLGFEYNKPIAQVVTGTQLQSKNSYTLSWTYMM